MGGGSAGHSLQLTGNGRRTGFQVNGLVGQQIVRDHVVAIDTQQMMGEGRQHAGPVLARRAMYQHRPVTVSYSPEIAAEQVQMGIGKWQFAIGSGHETPPGVRCQVGVFQEGDVRSLADSVQIALDHLAIEADGASRRLLGPLDGPPQIHDGADVQR